MANPPVAPKEKVEPARLVTLIVAVRNCVHASNGKVYLPGQEFSAPAGDAEDLIKQGVALPVAEE